MYKKKLVFWSRLVAWFVTGSVIPIAVFATKFGLFKPSKMLVETDSLGNIIYNKPHTLNGWGIISCILIGMMIIQALKEILESYTDYSLAKQTLEGIIKSVIPLVITYGICYFLNGVISEIMFCLAVIIITRLMAIPLNPLPKWRYEKTGTEDYSDVLSKLIKAAKRVTTEPRQ